MVSDDLAVILMKRLAAQDERLDAMQAKLDGQAALFRRIGKLCEYLGEAYVEAADRSRA